MGPDAMIFVFWMLSFKPGFHPSVSLSSRGPITSWQIEGDKVEVVTDFLFLVSRITNDGDYSHETRRRLLLGRKAMTNLDNALKSRDITLLFRVMVHMVKAMVFPVVMSGCESWMVKKEKSWKIDAFKLWCWRRLLKVPWTARRSNQSILRKINPEYSLEGRYLSWSSSIFVIWCKQRTHCISPWCWERLRAEGKEGFRGWDGWMAWLM